MIGTAEDHHSNPMKIALADFKRKGGKFIAINPVRSGYAAIADEWVPIKPGTDGALFLSIINEIIKQCRKKKAVSMLRTNFGGIAN
jgi:anaerobic selenocysteine-containing dehydrogenase